MPSPFRQIVDWEEPDVPETPTPLAPPVTPPPAAASQPATRPIPSPLADTGTPPTPRAAQATSSDDFISTDIPPRTPPAGTPAAGPRQESSTNTRAFNAVPWLFAALVIAMVIR